ncbi:hypothetical protein IID62_07055 [candidate division KSB1 bacterium]|nr:hypothetical protein [candidate division KSB1 bacterium]MCH8287140.1 hypothetical protein [candidate division KSB1 bacterium]
MTKTITEIKEITEKILEGQTNLQHDIHEIKMNLFDPDNGLYSRVGKNTGFRIAAGKWLWILTTGLFLTIIQGFIRYVFK